MVSANIPEPSPERRIINATDIILRDSKDRPRLVLSASMLENDGPSVHFFDEAGQVRAMMGLHDGIGGSPAVVLLDRQGNSRVRLVGFDTGEGFEGGLQLTRPSTEGQVELSVISSDLSGPGVLIYDKDNAARLILGINPETGEPFVGLADSDGETKKVIPLSQLHAMLEVITESCKKTKGK